MTKEEIDAVRTGELAQARVSVPRRWLRFSRPRQPVPGDRVLLMEATPDRSGRLRVRPFGESVHVTLIRVRDESGAWWAPRRLDLTWEPPGAGADD
jgi:hypothetical protein